MPEDLSAYDGLELRVKGDGRRYKLIVRTSTDWDTVGYTAGFDTAKGEWQSVSIPIRPLLGVFKIVFKFFYMINQTSNDWLYFFHLKYSGSCAIYLSEANLSSSYCYRCPTF